MNTVPAFLFTYGVLATLALLFGGYHTVKGKVETMRAQALAYRADSIATDWTARKCTPGRP